MQKLLTKKSKNMKKNFLTFKMTLVVTMLTVSMNAFAQVSVWDGSHTIWTNGSGTEANPYLIENAAHLAHLAVYVNVGTNVNAQNTVGANTYWKLTTNIDLNSLPWTPIGNRFTMDDYFNFGGHLDGDHHTIANLVINGGLRNALISMMDGGSVKNLGIVGNSSIGNSERAAGFICSASGAITIDNCYNTGNISASAAATTTAIAGGIVGWSNGNLTITNCNVSSDVLQSSTVAGGILGYFAAGTISIAHCNNNGTVSASVVDNSSINTYAGGIVGYSTGAEISINDCSNMGEVSAEAYDRYAFSGGMVGYMGSSFTIEECNNFGNVYASNLDETYAYTPAVGGMIGITGDNSDGSIYECHNMGAISDGASFYSHIGGIVGLALGNGFSVDNSSNAGAISANSGDAGGIIGEALYASVTISNCFNSSNDISGNMVGGIMGSTGFYNQVIINNCYNTGSFSSGNRAGGIIGDACCNPTINKCYNTGNISSFYAGGIVGNANTSSSNYNFTINNCYNTGNISNYICGGIVGSISGKGITVNNCYNTGTIAEGSDCGGIVGEITNAVINNSYYLNSSATNSGGGVAQTETFMKTQEFVALLNNGPAPNHAYTRDLELINNGYPIFGWDATLSNLMVSKGELTPAFNSDIYDYSVDVTYNVSSIIITATANHENATVSGDGAKQLAVGANLFTITVTAENGVTTLDYTVTVNRAEPSTDATLSSLTISEGEFTPAFNSDIFEYTVDVAYTVTAVRFIATATHSKAIVAGDGLKQLATGANLFTITVTAEDGVAKLDYAVTVNRAGVGVNELEITNSELRVFPNPTTGVLNLIQETMNNEQLTMNNVEILDIYGKKLSSNHLIPSSSNHLINISHLPAGIYFLKVGNETVKIVKQ